MKKLFIALLILAFVFPAVVIAEDMTITSKRVQYGDSARALKDQIKNRIDGMVASLQNLYSLKSTISSDDDFTQEDLDAVDALIDLAASYLGGELGNTNYTDKVLQKLQTDGAYNFGATTLPWNQ